MKSRKFTPRFVGPFEVDLMVNSATLQLKLPLSINIHSTSYVSWVKPALESKLDPAVDNPVRIIDGAHTYMIQRILDVCQLG